MSTGTLHGRQNNKQSLISWYVCVGQMFGTATQAYMLSKLLAEQFDAADNRASRRVSQRAERFAADVVADVQEQIEVLLFASAMFQAVENLGQPVGSLAARRTFATRLVAIKLGHTQDGSDHTGILVHHDHGSGPSHGASRSHRFVIHRDIDLVSRQHRSRGATWHKGLELFIAQDAPAILFIIDQRAKRRIDGQFVVTRLLDMTAQTEDARALALLGANRGVPFCAMAQNGRQSRERLAVINNCRTAIETHHRWKGRFQTRITALAL